uniref:Phosphoglycerate mutase-like protein n=2 Tax=Gonium pectorale TaxID=33097 RepID=A0A140JWW7_GONPE|nr:phosphoglycerate mutase-like protein [Gonium pectorale]BAU61617.1 phosphoglycerate mutase-like protein [Gonium pectorale]
MSLTPFLKTPHMEETGAAQGGDTTIQKKIELLKLRTHEKLRPVPATEELTQGRPAVPEAAAPESPCCSDDFIISMSQTYERTRPEPCSASGKDTAEDEELSQHRTQQYFATQSTQLYHLHQRQLMASAACAGATAQGTAEDEVAATCTVAPAAEECLTAEALGSDGEHVAAMLLPPDVGLEGQASSQPQNPAERADDLRDAAGLSSTLLAPRESLDFLCQPNILLPSVSTGPALTPELPGYCGGPHGAADVLDDGATPPVQVGVPVFPIFNPQRTRRRPVYLVRHGESEYNLASMRRRGFGEPCDIFDARLTPRGEKQARSLRPQVLELMQQHGDPLFVISPLSRAIETFLHMLPDPERLSVGMQGLQVGQNQPPVASTSATASSTAPSLCGSSLLGKPLNVVVSSSLAEFLLTTGDIGRPRSVLIDAYPQLSEPLKRGLEKERWWYENAQKGPNDAITKVLTCREPDKVSKARVDRFRHFLLSEPHRPIVVVGHANFFKTLTHDSCYMKNCQIVTWAP